MKFGSMSLKVMKYVSSNGYNSYNLRVNINFCPTLCQKWLAHLVRIAYKKTDEWSMEWQRMTASGTTTYENEWCKEWQRITANERN